MLSSYLSFCRSVFSYFPSTPLICFQFTFKIPLIFNVIFRENFSGLFYHFSWWRTDRENRNKNAENQVFRLLVEYGDIEIKCNWNKLEGKWIMRAWFKMDLRINSKGIITKCLENEGQNKNRIFKSTTLVERNRVSSGVADLMGKVLSIFVWGRQCCWIIWRWGMNRVSTFNSRSDVRMSSVCYLLYEELKPILVGWLLLSIIAIQLLNLLKMYLG